MKLLKWIQSEWDGIILHAAGTLLLLLTISAAIAGPDAINAIGNVWLALLLIPTLFAVIAASFFFVFWFIERHP